MKLTWPTREVAQEHYRDLAGKKFFPGLCEYFSSGPITAMVWEGTNVIATGRRMLGATNPADSAPGTIRGDYAIDVGRNIIHGSDSVESAAREIRFWFKPEELHGWAPAGEKWVYE